MSTRRTYLTATSKWQDCMCSRVPGSGPRVEVEPSMKWIRALCQQEYGGYGNENIRRNPYDLTQECANSKMVPGDCGPPEFPRRDYRSRYTIPDWVQHHGDQYCNTERIHQMSKQIQRDTVELLELSGGPNDMSQDRARTELHLRNSVMELKQQRDQLTDEIKENEDEFGKLLEVRNLLGKAHKELNEPRRIIRETLSIREYRKGIEKVHDTAEKCLLRELCIIQRWKDLLLPLIDNVNLQLGRVRATRIVLEKDVPNKDMAIDVNKVCLERPPLFCGNDYAGASVEEIDNAVSDQSSGPVLLAAHIKESQCARDASRLARENGNKAVSQMVHEIWEAWCFSGMALAERAKETLRAKEHLDYYLHKLDEDIQCQADLLGKLTTAARERLCSEKLARARLEKRMDQPCTELWRDQAHNNLVLEARKSACMSYRLYDKASEAEFLKERMQEAREAVKDDINQKLDTVRIDRDTCLRMRSPFPFSITVFQDNQEDPNCQLFKTEKY